MRHEKRDYWMIIINDDGDADRTTLDYHIVH